MAGGFFSRRRACDRRSSITKVLCSPVAVHATVLLLGGSKMGKQKAVSILVTLALVVAAGAAFVLWPKHYTVGQRISETTVFWNDREAFLFLAETTTGRAQNVFQEKLAGTRYGYLAVFLGGYMDFTKAEVVAYHLVSSGQLDRFALPEHTVAFGSWGLTEGRLQLTASPVATGNGFRWDGENFVSLSAPPAANAQPKAAAMPNPNLTEDDLENDDEADDSGPLPKSERKPFKDAGWHYKFLSGYVGQGSAATLPINLAGRTFNLTVESFPLKNIVARFDFMTIGTRSIRLAGEKLAGGQQTLWNQSGWRDVSKQDYQDLQRQYGRQFRTPLSGVWLLLVAFLLLWRFGSWIHVLFTFATIKSRVLKKMPTSYSFPPATPAQFPMLDLDALDRYTRELEGMGFTRLLDFSLVSDSATNPPSFCRLFAHVRHHCFGELSQIFPKGKAPLPLKCCIQSCLQNGWSVSFASRKPLAAGSLLQRKKAIGVFMPDVPIPELLPAFLKMRDQVCFDLGISPVNDDTLQAYIDKMQRAIGEMREAVQEKNFVKGVPEVYLRKFSLMKTKPEYVWLGDYPKEAEQRRQGVNSFAVGAR